VRDAEHQPEQPRGIRHLKESLPLALHRLALVDGALRRMTPKDVAAAEEQFPGVLLGLAQLAHGAYLLSSVLPGCSTQEIGETYRRFVLDETRQMLDSVAMLARVAGMCGTADPADMPGAGVPVAAAPPPQGPVTREWPADQGHGRGW
jgi:hypothetical protein